MHHRSTPPANQSASRRSPWLARLAGAAALLSAGAACAQPSAAAPAVPASVTASMTTPVAAAVASPPAASTPVPPAATDAARQRETRLWAASCAACHGTDGKASGAALPLAGKTAEHLYTSLLGFKSGERPSTVMHRHAKGYSDAELQRLAEHFAGIK
jgi:sulfide dehydrogenase cytochrome subunit